ncbi:PCMD domain-containing protein [Flavobacteriales bacterium]|nr:PCMD domain-containing protein [Flavobacteriales bacterium]
MKKIYISFLSMTIGLGAFAQAQLENPGFESWENLGTNEREPVEWSSTRTGDNNASTPDDFVVDRSATVRPGTSGAYSVLLETKTVEIIPFIFSVEVNGILTNGQVDAPTTTPSDGFNKTVTANSDFNTEFSDFPDSLVAWVNYQPAGNDDGRIQCILHTVNGAGTAAGSMGTLPEVGGTQGDNTGNVVARADQDITSNTGGWIRIALPFNYANANTPEYILVTATSSVAAGAGTDGSKMYVDDLQLIYNITPELASSTVDVSIFSAGSLDVDYSTGGTPLAATDFVVELSDENGSFVSPTVIGSAAGTMMADGTISCSIPMGTMAGTGYMVRVTNVSENYASIEVPLTITNLTVGITAASEQNIKVFGSNGNLTIDLSSTELESPVLNLVSLNGQRVAVESLISGSVNTISRVNAGVYLVQIQHKNGVYTTKLFVQ